MEWLFNLGSILFGLTAWALPVIQLVQRTHAGTKNNAVFSALSLGACAISLWMQIFYTDYLVMAGNWTELLGTSRTVAWLNTMVLVVTIILNEVALRICFRKELGVKKK